MDERPSQWNHINSAAQTHSQTSPSQRNTPQLPTSISTDSNSCNSKDIPSQALHFRPMTRSYSATGSVFPGLFYTKFDEQNPLPGYGAEVPCNGLAEGR
jgi:hypothetical protein